MRKEVLGRRRIDRAPGRAPASKNRTRIDPGLCGPHGALAGIFAVHSWIVVKEPGATNYTRYDYTAWGEPIRQQRFCGRRALVRRDARDHRGRRRRAAARLIPKIRNVIEHYRFRTYGDYSAWPGPNSNTFVRAVLDAVPELKAVLPPTAIGKDYPYDDWIGPTASGTGVFVSLAGYFGVTIGWVEGFEINFLGAVVGFDVRRPALNLPGVGRLGMEARLSGPVSPA
jgi:hypothetical protein